MRLSLQIARQLEGKSCEVLAAPFDVRLPLGDEEEADIANVVQPDIALVCDIDKLDEKGCLGAPDLVIEILSISTSQKDRKEKFYLYEQAGVHEYWLVSPYEHIVEHIVEVFTLDANGKYGRPEIYSPSDHICLSKLKELRIDLGPVFTLPAKTARFPGVL